MYCWFRALLMLLVIMVGSLSRFAMPIKNIKYDEVVQFLLAHKAIVTEQKRLDSQLFNAIADEDSRMVALSLKNGANVNACNSYERTPLMQVLAKSLLNNIYPRLDDLPLIDTAAKRFIYDNQIRERNNIIRTLLSAGADVNHKDYLGMSALMIACVMKSIDSEGITLILNAGHDINMQSCYGRTALMEAANAGSQEVVAILLELRPQLNLVDNDGRTAYALSIKECVCRMLIEAGADSAIDCNSNYQHTPFIIASKNRLKDPIHSRYLGSRAQ